MVCGSGLKARAVNLDDLLPAIRPVLTEFDRLGIVYYVGGSVASSKTWPNILVLIVCAPDREGILCEFWWVGTMLNRPT